MKAYYWRGPDPLTGADAGRARPQRPLRLRAAEPGRARGEAEAAPPVPSFGPFTVQPRERRLLLAGEPVALGGRAFDLLLMLLEAGGGLVTKEAILGRVWHGVVVEENNLQVQVSALRRVLGPHRGWIVTVPGRGYRFTAPVTQHVAGPGRPGNAATAPRLSLLVLPLVALGEDPARQWFTDGLSDTLTTDLARAHAGFEVASAASARPYRGEGVDVRRIGREQHVRFVLEGSILLAACHARVNAALVETGGGTTVWVERFDVPRGDVLALQDGIVGRLSRAVGLQVLAAEARLAERAAEACPECPPDVRDLVLRGRAAARQPGMTPATAQAALALFEAALALEPDEPDALAGAASLHAYQVVNGFLEHGSAVRGEAARAAALDEAERQVSRVLAVAPGHLDALRARMVVLRARGAFADALAAAATVLAHDPGDVVGHRESGLNLLYLGRTEEAAAWFRRTDALAPNDPMRWNWLQGLGRALIQLGRDEEAADVLRLAVESNPARPLLHALLAAALALLGQDELAGAQMAIVRRARPDMPIESLARQSPVPHEATSPAYRSRNERLVRGMLQAGRSLPEAGPR